MNRFRANKKLGVLDAKIRELGEERRALEAGAFGAELTDAERRDRYFSIGDPDLRRKAIRAERALHDLRQRQQAATVDYLTSVTAETRDKLEDLKSTSPASAWRRGIWWDVLTILWILAGAGWLALGLPGAAGGAVISAVSGWFIVRNSEKTRVKSIREGEEILRSSETQLKQAQHDAARSSPAQAIFSAAEEQTGTPDK